MKNLIGFFEIPAQDFSRAVTFYQNILGIELEVFDWETEKMAFFPSESEKAVGAISFAKDFVPSSDGVLIHFEVEDMEVVLDKVIANGGKTVCPKTKIECEGRGYFALFIDSEGNKLGLSSES